MKVFKAVRLTIAFTLAVISLIPTAILYWIAVIIGWKGFSDALINGLSNVLLTIAGKDDV